MQSNEFNKSALSANVVTTTIKRRRTFPWNNTTSLFSWFFHHHRFHRGAMYRWRSVTTWRVSNVSTWRNISDLWKEVIIFSWSFVPRTHLEYRFLRYLTIVVLYQELVKLSTLVANNNCTVLLLGRKIKDERGKSKVVGIPIDSHCGNLPRDKLSSACNLKTTCASKLSSGKDRFYISQSVVKIRVAERGGYNVSRSVKNFVRMVSQSRVVSTLERHTVQK